MAIPDFLADELRDYVKMCYELNPTDRLFSVRKSFLANNLHGGAARAGLKQIRVHDLRHSHIRL